MSKPPLDPYPPDPGDEAAPVELGGAGIVDATVAGADWANIRAPKTTLRRVELSQVRLTGAELAECTLSDVLFSDCRLDLVGLRASRLERVVFRDCRMEECDFYGATLKDVLFERCSLRLATVSEVRLQRVELRRCELAGLAGVASLRGARLLADDALENAALFAAALGIELVE